MHVRSLDTTSLTELSSVHTMPVPVGKGSFSVTPFAVPGPAFETTIANPMGSPALTLAAPAALVMRRSGHKTVVLALAFTTGWFVAFALAVLGYSLHEANVVGEVRCTLV